MANSSTSTRASYGRIIYAPTLTFHDPNPPITIENGDGLNDTVVETITASDFQTVTVSFVSDLNETVTATDSQTAGLGFSDTVSETVTATDSATAGLGLSDTVAETVTASDTCDATVVTPPAPPPPPPVQVPAPLPGPLYGLNEIGVASATATFQQRGVSSSQSPLHGVGTAGNKDSILPVKGPIP